MYGVDEWRNGIKMTEEEKYRVKLLRNAGCKCELPLLGYAWSGSGVRCRLCNVEVEGYGLCEDCIWFGFENGCNVERGSELCELNRKEIE